MSGYHSARSVDPEGVSLLVRVLALDDADPEQSGRPDTGSSSDNMNPIDTGGIGGHRGHRGMLQ